MSTIVRILEILIAITIAAALIVIAADRLGSGTTIIIVPEAESAAETPAPKTALEQIVLAAKRFNVDDRVLLSIANCESGMQHDGIFGDGGAAYGIMQFHEPTFDMFKQQAGMPELDYKNRDDQIVLAAWALKNGLGYHWTCYKPNATS